MRLPAILAAAVAAVAVAVPAHAATPVLEAETLTLSPGAGTAYDDDAASGGRALLLWSTGAATGTLRLSSSSTLFVRARGDQCAGAPHLEVAIDGKLVLSADVPSPTFTDLKTAKVSGGSHQVAVRFTNDALTSACDRNLRVDALSPSRLTIAAPTPTVAPLYVDPDSDARRQADAWRTSRPADAAQMDKIAAQPSAAWFGEWSGDVTAAVTARTQAAADAGAVPVLVAYAIPQRDCGGFSAGGTGTPDGYRAWIRQFADGLGTRRAIVVLEPDALAAIDCLPAADRQTRLDLLRDAVTVLSAHAGTQVYLDAGHSAWIGAAEMASRLQGAGISVARGFALDVSNFRSDAELLPYGRDLSARVGGKPFAIDTSRNGLGPDPAGAWCNPPGRALGRRPTLETGEAGLDAYLWVKRPGESDGTCNGGPAAGTWWADYALGLAQRAAY